MIVTKQLDHGNCCTGLGQAYPLSIPGHVGITLLQQRATCAVMTLVGWVEVIT